MSDTKDRLRSSGSFSDKSKEEQLHYGSSRDWKEERNKKTSLETDNRNLERTPNRDSDSYKYGNRNREDWRDRDRDRDIERERERDRNRQRSPPRRTYRSPARPVPRSPERDRRDRPREREERGRAEQREGVRFRDRERRRSVERLDRSEGRYGREVDRSRSSPPPRVLREGYHGVRERSPYRERKHSTQTVGEYHREQSPYSRGRSSPYRGRQLEDSSPRRRSPLYRDYPWRNSPVLTRGISPQRRASPGRGTFGKEGYSRPLDRPRSPQPITSYGTRDKNSFPITYAFRDEAVFESKERDTTDGEFGRAHFANDPNTNKSKGVPRYDRLAFSSKEDTSAYKYSNSSAAQNNRKTGSSAVNRVSRVNQHYPGNTVSTLRDLSDRPLKRDRGEDPPPPPTEPSESWVEKKRARLRSRVEAENILDMELIILSEKQREYAEKVEHRIKHMGVTTSLITLPPSMGVAEALDSAVKRNLLYAIIILPQHEQHNSITLTILHGRNPQEHKNMPLEDSLCLINIDHEKYEEAIRDRVIESRDAERISKDVPLSPDSTPEKPSLDLEQLSEIVKRFPPTQSDLNKNSKDLQAKIIGLLGSSAILPSTAEEPRDPDTRISTQSVTSPLTPFGQMSGYPPTMLPPPNFMYSFPHPHAFTLPTGPISPLHFQPHGTYMHPAMLGHPPSIPGGFPPRH